MPEESLERADLELNQLYRQLIDTSTAPRTTDLKSEQRAWMKQRNQSCQLTSASTAQQDWIAVLSQDHKRATCVYGSMSFRLNQLRNYRAAQTGDVGQVVDRHEVTCPISHKTGKWYLEVNILAKNYNDAGGANLMQVAATDGRSLVGMQLSRAQMAGRVGADGEYTVGVALDLDIGKLYWSQNGEWKDGLPGSAAGPTLNRNGSYTVRVISSGPSLSLELKRGFISMNAGQRPFKFATPAGYRPFYVPPADAATSSHLGWIVPSYKRVQGKSYSEWAEQFWGWLLAKAPNRDPTEDTTGQFCTEDQSGSVWFLAGGDAASHITRTCTIPTGKFLFVPTVVHFVQVLRNGDVTCAKMEKDRVSETAIDAIESAFITIDGETFDSLYDYRPYSRRCTAILGRDGAVIVPQAMFHGICIMLQPLPAGDHVIRMGGTLPALNTYRDVTYHIHVK